jgi:NAD-dependent SIR2 family protein deacetylase
MSIDFKYIQTLIRNAEAVVITAGAGMGVDSGLPDFRGNKGFWKAYPVLKDKKLSFKKIASPKWFIKNPQLAWAFYGHRLNLYKNTKPHEGFTLLKEYLEKNEKEYFVFTSNVDGHFQKAGYDSDRIVEIHGSINFFQCTVECVKKVWDAPDNELNIDISNMTIEDIPICPYCSRVARPNILMFDDWFWMEKRTYAQKMRYRKWIKEKKSVVVLEFGAGKVIPTVRNFSEEETYKMERKESGTLIRINPQDESVWRDQDIAIKMGAFEAIRKIVG